MSRLAGVAALVAVLTGGASAHAQEAQESPPSPFSMHVEMGVAGFVDPREPLSVRVDLTAQELLVGRIEVTSGGAVTNTAIEVPAAGLKSYVIEAAAPGSRRNIAVAVIQETGEATERRVMTETVRVRVPSDELLVGILDAGGIETTLRSVETTPLSRKVTPVAIEPELLETAPRVLSYLVVGDGALAALSPAGKEGLDRWVRQGGRLFGPAAAVSVIADPASGDTWPGTSAVLARHGLGEVGALDPAATTVTEWGRLLRGTPPLGLVRNEGLDAAPFGLVSAAAAGRDATVPALPWLLGGIVLFIVLVGPVNFLLLRRLGKPELAWLTVPGLSVIFVAGFWFLGRSQLDAFTVSQASVLVEAEGRIDGYTGLVLQVEEAGDHELVLPEGWQAQPASSGGAVTGTPQSTGRDRSALAFALEDLGVGVGQATWSRSEPVDVVVSLRDTGENQQATVANRSGAEFWSWGLVVNGLGYLSAEALPDAASGELTVRTGRALREVYEPVIAEVVNRGAFNRQDFDATSYGLVNALAAYAETRITGLRGSGVYFFGFTDGLDPQVAVDGREASADGTTLVVKKLELGGADAVSLGAVRPELLEISGASSIEAYWDEIYAFGADEVYLRYLVPEGVPPFGQISPTATRLRTVEAFHWDTAAFEPIAWGDPIDFDRYVSPGGELIVRASHQDDFFEESLRLARFQLTWSSA